MTWWRYVAWCFWNDVGRWIVGVVLVTTGLWLAGKYFLAHPYAY